MKTMQNLINFLKSKPQFIFLIDGLGAFLTAFSLFFILRPLNEFIGMPKSVLTYLSLLSLILCLYSFSCFFLMKHNWRHLVKIIITLNLFYCILTSGLLVYNHRTIAFLGISYFFVEILVICALVYVEFKTVSGHIIHEKGNLIYKNINPQL